MTGKRKCTDLGGLYRTMPITMWCGIVGALAISAFPLTSGFVSKSMISTAAASEHLTWVWLILTAASGGVFLHAGIKFPWFVFFQKDSGMRPKDPPRNMQLAMLIFAFLCVFLGAYKDPLYAMLPFEVVAHGPATGQQVVYEPNTFAHVVNQLQLLMFSGLAFFLLLPMLKRTETISVDFDWFYRRGIPGLWNQALLPTARVILRAQGVAIDRCRRVLTTDMHVRSFESVFLERWPVGQAVVLITLLLLVFLLFNLFAH